MYQHEVNQLAEAAQKKLNFLKDSKLRYIISATMAGVYVGLGIILIYIIGGYFDPVYPALTKTVMGLSISVALCLVMFAGAELYTGNTMVMTVGALEKKLSWRDACAIWFFSFLGNTIGSLLISFLFWQSGLLTGSTADFILQVAATKMNTPLIQLFVRGVLCNILVCLSVWCYYKMKSETGKILLITMCLFAFITSGYEHCIANVTLLSMACVIPHPATISWGGLVYNVAVATLGNWIGGAVLIGMGYWYISKPGRTQKGQAA